MAGEGIRRWLPVTGRVAGSKMNRTPRCLKKAATVQGMQALHAHPWSFAQLGPLAELTVQGQRLTERGRRLRLPDHHGVRVALLPHLQGFLAGDGDNSTGIQTHFDGFYTFTNGLAQNQLALLAWHCDGFLRLMELFFSPAALPQGVAGQVHSWNGKLADIVCTCHLA